ncbi:MAG TPA: BrnT family toxin [Candidatus Saccharimonadales bacterium]|nr:BrnT family toxin [Candidatus Saccharimonadales bacterium]
MEITLPEKSHFEWDAANISHIAKHNVVPEEAEEVFYQEPQIITYDEEHSTKETRYAFLGKTKQGRLVTIIFTLRGKQNETIRVISARDQSKKERKEYDEEVRKGSDASL